MAGRCLDCGGRRLSRWASRAEADGRKKQKKMCCFHWLAEEEFVKVALENSDGNSRKKQYSS